MSRAGLLRRRLLLSLAAVLVAWIVAEVVLRAWPIPGRRANLHAQFIEADARLGWRHRRDVRGSVDTDEFSHELVYNERGLRGTVLPYDKPVGTQRVALLGDSFLDGYTVPYRDRVDSRLQEALTTADVPVEVLAFGTPGYSTDQELLVLRDEVLRYAPDQVVLLFHDNDVVFNGRRHFSLGPKPRFRMDGDALILEDAPEPGLAPQPTSGAGERFRTLCRNSRVYRWLSHAWKGDADRYGWLVRNGWAQAPGELLTEVHGVEIPAEFLVYVRPEPAEIPQSWRVTERLLVTFRDELSTAGVEFLVFYVPPFAALSAELRDVRNRVYGLDEGQWDFRVVGARLAEICSRHGVSFVDPRDSFQESGVASLYFPVDGHWTAEGHAAAAAAIQDWLRR